MDYGRRSAHGGSRRRNRSYDEELDSRKRRRIGKDGFEEDRTKENGTDKARGYQLEVLEQAKSRNTIAFLDVGTGKTLIAVLLIESKSKQLGRTLAVFLVPKWHLVKQQAEAIRQRTKLAVGQYHGRVKASTRGVLRDLSSTNNEEEEKEGAQLSREQRSWWKDELRSKEILVMTPQILLSNLKHGVIRMDSIDVLVMDECHNAVTDHPYARIMRTFYLACPKDRRPCFFGMTASPVTQLFTNGSVACPGVSGQYDCAEKLRNLETLLDSKICTISNRQELDRYVPSPSERIIYYDKACLHELHKQILKTSVEVEQKRSFETDATGSAKLLQKLRAVLYALDELGQWSAYKVAYSYLSSLRKAPDDSDTKFQEKFLIQVTELLQCELCAAMDFDIEDGEITTVETLLNVAADGKFTPKVHTLVKLLLQYEHVSDFRGIVFVDRVAAAMALPKVLSELSCLKFLTCESVVGNNQGHCSRGNSISRFRDGRVTLLVCTSVAEEGLDIQQCDVVIRFDLSNIQSRGGGRKQGSENILMLERGNEAHLRSARRSELTLMKEAVNRTQLDQTRATTVRADAVYKVASRVSVTSNTAAEDYCSQLPRDRDLATSHHEDGRVSCSLKPLGDASLQFSNGPPCKRARQSVCLEACKRHDELEDEVLAGNARQREYYPEVTAEILKDDWIISEKPSQCLFMYKVQCTNSGESTDPLATQVSDFAILVGKKLYPEVLKVPPLVLYITRNLESMVSLEALGTYHFSREEINLLKKFHLSLMSVVLDVQAELSETSWDAKKAYLFVPLTLGTATVNRVDWELIHRVTRSSQLQQDQMQDGPHLSPSQPRLYTKDGPVNADELMGKILMATHSGKHFYVESICDDVNADSPFPPSKHGDYETYADYYKQKYAVDLRCRSQPMIRARGVPRCKNLLCSRFEKAAKETDKAYNVMLPAELCRIHPLPGCVVRGAHRLPSVMKRVESLLLAIQLKHEISCPTDIPAEKVLEALTAVSCQETLSYERVELLGDGCLKWIISQRLFLEFPDKHEGQLTKMRQQAVNNLTLYKLARSRCLQNYVQVDRFSPSRWAAPGFPKQDEEPHSNLAEQHPEKEHQENDNSHETDRETEGRSYRIISNKTLADVVEALIGVYYINDSQAPPKAASHIMKWFGIEIKYGESNIKKARTSIPESVMGNVDFQSLEGSIGYKFKSRNLLVEALSHASQPSADIPCYQRLEFLGDAVLDHLITKYLFTEYQESSPGALTDSRSALVNNENFARLCVKHGFHLHLRHGSMALESQIQGYVNQMRDKPVTNSFGVGDLRAPKVLGDIFEAIVGAVFLDTELKIEAIWEIIQPLLQPEVKLRSADEGGDLQPFRELLEYCQSHQKSVDIQMGQSGNVATATIVVDGEHISTGRGRQKKLARKLAAKQGLEVLKARNTNDTKQGEIQIFTKQRLNDLCLRRQWDLPEYRRVDETGPPHSRRFTYVVRVKMELGWTEECRGESMPSVKKAQDSAAMVLLELLYRYETSPNSLDTPPMPGCSA